MIKIKGIDYKVVRMIDETTDPEFFLLGQIQHHKALIAVRTNDTNQQVQQHAFLHEAIHGILPKGSDDEEFVDLISSDLYAFLVDNDLLKDGWWDKILDDKEEGIRAIYVDHAVRELDGTTKEGVAG